MSVRYDLHHYFHVADDDALVILHRIEAKMSALLDELNTVKTKLQDLKDTTVANNRTLLQGLNAIIADLRANPGDATAALAAAQALEQQVDSIKATLEGDDTANQPPA